MNQVQIKGVRPFFLNGQTVRVGEVVAAGHIAAIDACGSGRAEFVSVADRDAAIEVARAEYAKASHESFTKRTAWMKW